MYTIKYLIKRIVMYIITLSLAISLNFLIPRLVPGSPIQQKFAELIRMGETMGGTEFIEKYEKLFALDQPLQLQFFYYISGLLSGNLGFSISYFPSTVTDLIMKALPWTVGLLVVSLMISFTCGIFLGSLMGWLKREGRESKWMESIWLLSLFLSHIPFYIFAMILVFLLTFIFPLFPYGGGIDPFMVPGTIDYILSILRHAFLPALSIVIIQIGGWSMSVRGLLVSVLGEDYLFLAKAKGLKERRIFSRYAMRNVLLPQVTDLAISLGTIAGGSIIMESVFAYPGIGNLLFRAVKQLDYPLIQGITLIVVLGVTTAALIIDLLYPLLDPRIGEK